MKDRIYFNSDRISVEDIMQQISKRIRERRYDDDDLAELSKPLPAWDGEVAAATLTSHLVRLQELQNVPIYWEMEEQAGLNGRFRVFLKKVIRKLNFFYFSHVFGFQNSFNAHACACMNELAGLLRSVPEEAAQRHEELSAIDFELTALRGRTRRDLGALEQDISDLEGQTAELSAGLEQLRGHSDKRIDELNSRIHFTKSEDFKDELFRMKSEYLDQLCEIKKQHNAENDLQKTAFEQQLNAVKSEYDERLRRIEESYNLQLSVLKNDFSSNLNEVEKRYLEKQTELNSVYTVIASRLYRLENSRRMTEASAELSLLDRVVLPDFKLPEQGAEFDYFTFEARFRGSPEQIREKQLQYLKYFEGEENILDFGCGRGEFLSLLDEHGISATGVDLLDENIYSCTERGLNAVCCDGLSWLEDCEDDSLGGIFSAQVIEHLEQSRLVRLLRTAYRKLKSGSCIVLETLNPRCLMIFAESFYMDPSHCKPVHPETLKFICECEGFTDNELLFLTPSDSSVQLPLLNGHSEADNAIRTINSLLFGNREYALIARKPL